MADTEQTDTDAGEAAELHNTFMEGTYTEQDDRGHVFELANGETAVVDPGEFEGEAPFEEGDKMELLVEQPADGAWSASARKVDKLEMWAGLEEARKNRRVIEGDILKENKGGLSVDIGLRAFLPRSHVELHQVDDCGQYVGRSEEFTIIKFDKKRCNVVVSRRKVLEQEREQKKQETIDAIEEGEVFEGTVRNLKPYGAFVDIGGVDGLLHISNIGWRRIDHPSEELEPGEKLDVVVLEFDPDEERLSLGRKQLLDDPWEEFEASHEEGQIIEGEVVSLADFGAFVEVAPGLEGLVHVTELSWTDRTNHPGEVLDVGDELEVKIIDIDSEQRRVGLSVKQLEPNPWKELAGGRGR
ncbi:MAG: 30S ribosomal protein S1, partial [Bradymonadaceae bacterium]